MQKINTYDGLFKNYNKINLTAGTVITAEWLNAVQQELTNAIEAFGVSLDSTRSDQLKDIIIGILDGKLDINNVSAIFPNMTGQSGKFLATDGVNRFWAVPTVSHLDLINKGDNTHAQIDQHIASRSNPHNITKEQLDLENVINVKQQPESLTLTALSLTAAEEDKVPYYDGINSAKTTTLTSFARNILDDVSAEEVRATLGLGSSATKASTEFEPSGSIQAHVQAYNHEGMLPANQVAAAAGTYGTPSDINRYVTNSDSRLSDARTPLSHNHNTLYEPINANIQNHISSTSNPHSVTKAQVGLTNVTDVQQQPINANLTAISGLSPVADKLPYFTGEATAALATFTTFARTLLDAADAATACSTLGIGSIATQASNNVSITGGSISGLTSLSSSVITSTVATGTSPFTVTSSTLVTNLNADTVDGFHASQAPGANEIPVLNSAGRLVLDGTDDGSSKIQTGGVIKSTGLKLSDSNFILWGNGQSRISGNAGVLTEYANTFIHYRELSVSPYYWFTINFTDGGQIGHLWYGKINQSDTTKFIGTHAVVPATRFYANTASDFFWAHAPNNGVGGELTFTNRMSFQADNGVLLLGPTLPTWDGTSTLQVAGGISSTGLKLSDTNEILWGDGSCKISGSGATDIITLTGTLLQVNGGVSLVGNLNIKNAVGSSLVVNNYSGANSTGANVWIGGGGTSSIGESGATHKGSCNVAAGTAALNSATTAYWNAATGYTALYGITTGHSDTAVGYAAGRFISGGSVLNTISTASLYLGAATKAGADGNTNEIVIGFDTTGMGSNTAILGNSNITHTYLRGQVLIGTTTPQAGVAATINGLIALQSSSSLVGMITTGSTINTFRSSNILGLYSGGLDTDDEHLRLTSAGRILMGTTLPTDDGVNALQVNGTIKTSDTISVQKDAINHYRNVAHYSSAENLPTGTMKITLPKSWSNTMMIMKVTGYHHHSSSPTKYWEVIISGYNHSTTPAWLYAGAEIRGWAPFSEVRLAHDGTNCCVLLGNASTVWNIPKIAVTDFIVGHYGLTGWESGWTIALITDETGINYVNSLSCNTHIRNSLIVGDSTWDGVSQLQVSGAIKATGYKTATHNFTEGYINASTSDGSDNSFLIINGGGSNADVSRGSFIGVYGNEVATNGGCIFLTTGNVATGNINFRTGASTRMQINNAGRILAGPTLPTDDNVNALQVNGGVKVSETKTLSTATNTMLNMESSVTFTTGAYSYFGARIYPKCRVPTGVTSPGYGEGLVSYVCRNYDTAGTDDSGTLAYLIGNQVGFGHMNTNTSATPVTTTVYGLNLIPYALSGSITNMFGLRIANQSGSGTVTNKWGIYQEDSGYTNYFNGTTLIGTPTSDGVNKLQVNGTIASKGVKYDGTASSDVNTLDYYQEGTFTPVIYGETTAGSGTYTTQTGKYTRIGNIVHYNIALIWTAHTGTGNMRISGFPYNASVSCPCSDIYYDAFTVGSGKKCNAVLSSGGSSLGMKSLDPSGGAVAAIAIDTAGTLIIQGTYFV